EWSGRGPDWIEKLSRAADVARKHGAVLLAATTDRIVRSIFFKSSNKIACKAQAQEEQLREGKRVTEGVPLMTYLDPDAPPEECRSLLIRWGQGAKGNKGGRPRKENTASREEKQRWRPRVLELHERGLSCRDVADQVEKEAGFRVISHQ